jgi:hypothetical protein
MSQMQHEKGKTFLSWCSFKDILLDFKQDGRIYKHNNNNTLNDLIKKISHANFSFEGLLASALKCYTPSIALDYFYALKSIYILGRLISIYVQSTKKISVVDLYHIASSVLISYENKFHILSQVPRAVPKYEKGLSEETQAYFINHLITGPQYMLLKMIEKCLPIIAEIS